MQNTQREEYERLEDMNEHSDSAAPTQEQLDSPDRFNIPRYEIPQHDIPQYVLLIGGEASPEKCLRFRIWYYGIDGYAFDEYTDFVEARDVARARMRHDISFVRLVGVVWDNAYRDFREVDLINTEG